MLAFGGTRLLQKFRMGHENKRRRDVRKPAVCGSDGDVEDQIEGLIEGCVCLAGRGPGVVGRGAVDRRAGEFTVGPEIFVVCKVEEKDLLHR